MRLEDYDRGLVGVTSTFIGIGLAIFGYWRALNTGFTLIDPPTAPWWQMHLPMIVGLLLVFWGIRNIRIDINQGDSSEA